MHTIILYGDRNDKRLRDSILPVLTGQFKVQYYNEQVLASLAKGKKDKDLILLETSSLREIRGKNHVLILKNNAKIGALRFIENSTSIIVDAGNTKNILRLAQNNARIYTCGLSSKDYVTFSSREEEHAVVSLQRSIKTVSGRLCEPMELPCHTLAGEQEYPILARALCMILLGLT